MSPFNGSENNSGDEADLSPSRNVTATPSAEGLLQECKTLVSELKEFHALLKERKQEGRVELRQFQSSVLSEMRALEKLAQADPSEDRIQHALRSSNLPFYTAVWAAAKRSQGLVTFHKRFYWEVPARLSHKHDKASTDQANGDARAGAAAAAAAAAAPKPKKKSALVDIVAGNGLEWIKVSTITPARLGFEMAKAGWEGQDSGSASAASSTSSTLSDCSDDVSLLKAADDLSKASHATRISYQHPHIHFVLPKIAEGTHPAIDELLETIRSSTGATIECAQDLQQQEEEEQTSSPSMPELVDRLILSSFTSLTKTLNIDCTILLALVSDLSYNASLTPAPHLHRAIRRQIELEAHDHLLPDILWPAMGDRQLVCTAEAAKRMREIVDTIGTDDERTRTDLLLSDSSSSSSSSIDTPAQSPRERVQGFQSLSSYPVPKEWNLPVLVRPFSAASALSKLSHSPPPSSPSSSPSPSKPSPSAAAAAKTVSDTLSDINRSVFLYGWSEGHTTLSSNRTVAKAIEAVVEKCSAESEAEGKGELSGPDIWLCPVARSLVGKEKDRRE
ncbi:MAG: hypothetical protein M1819_000339 [Sarea resinae]|nr:MAG: hypothetical protein M1819_000339 [Sarea resinae]